MNPIRFTLLAICASALSHAETANDAWKKMVDPKFREATEFALPTRNPNLPNVLIYGDSISIHYHSELRSALEGKANLHRIQTNGGDSSTFVPKMELLTRTMSDERLSDPWDFSWDVVQFNVGLHDLKFTDGDIMDVKNGKQVSSLTVYENNLEKIILHLEKFSPQAKLIFATTTPVPENSPGRIAGDEEKYNEVAMRVLEKHPEISINDLYSLTKPNQSKWWVKPGDVHYGTEGQKAQADQTAEEILKALGK